MTTTLEKYLQAQENLKRTNATLGVQAPAKDESDASRFYFGVLELATRERDEARAELLEEIKSQGLPTVELDPPGYVFVSDGGEALQKYANEQAQRLKRRTIIVRTGFGPDVVGEYSGLTGLKSL
jgi:hypothetical protein